MKINIRRSVKGIINFLFLYTLIIQGLMSLFNLPQYMLYIKDIALVTVLLLDAYHAKKLSIKNADYLLLILLFYSLINGILKQSNFTVILIAIRKTFRGFAYFYLCVKYLDSKEIERNMHLCYRIQAMNLFIIAFQFFVLHKGPDFCNGIFGTGLTNNYNSLFCVIIIGYSTFEYINKKQSLEKYLINILIMLLITAIAELKILFFIIPMIIIVAFHKKIFTKKFMIILLIGIVAILGFVVIFSRVSEQLYSLISLSGLRTYIFQNEVFKWGRVGISRLNWIQFTHDNVFCDDIFLNLFGVGFGTVSGTLSGSATETVYTAWGYGAYVLSTIYLEDGLVGLILIILWFFKRLIDIRKIEKGNEDLRQIKKYTFGLLITAFVFLDYSNFIYNDSIFIFFYGLSMMYVIHREFRGYNYSRMKK